MIDFLIVVTHAALSYYVGFLAGTLYLLGDKVFALVVFTAVMGWHLSK